jgi:hypothetical protein
VVVLPDGARVRGRSLRRTAPPGPAPELGVILAGRRPPAVPWPARWVRWRDFGLPRDAEAAIAALREAHRCALRGGRAEVACAGGRGRTGTALACLAVMAGVAPSDAVSWVRRHYDPRAVETPGQRRFVARLDPDGGGGSL